MMTKKTFALLLAGTLSWAASAHAQKLPTPVTVGAERMELLLPTLQGKRVAMMVNQSSLVGSTGTHLVDTLLSQGINIVRLFVPEHGLRGKVDAGKNVRSGVDEKTGLPVVSLYGQRKRPTPEMLADIDLLVFDLQDVGTRFYTYISSMHYLMEACAEEGKTFVVCDRPNPNDFIDGPILEPDCRSFIGVDPLPVAHGMTVGELALMIDGERWLRGGNTCHVKVIPMAGWSHGDPYELPVRPSPNLPNSRSIELYPSLCFFEATIMSVGRGTSKPFQAIGYPDKRFGSIVYTPQIKIGEDSNPRHKGKLCYGTDYTSVSLPKRQIALSPLLDYYRKADSLGLQLINQRQLFDLLAGTKKLRQQLSSGLSEEEIRASWQAGLKAFQAKRARYLLYTDYR
ncbi:exo-beta-N-acetylmuramidase NamZ family protein [Porphyromonas pasteri]|uniref:DUF1343 domain-containing protein n=1 Tax=Porphyromonas pasteri TaxID=1583331 RepID=A0ABQ2H4Z5_9PORP|nr:DUF1343 domain-containing protein [Porphyromonas pasteri]GGM48330.1 hypothetical protein GCM10007088_03730 [Porphyromonas pasteri]